MAENKKYYWLKLKSDFFDDDTIQFIEEQENGILYVNFYLKLCLKSLKHNGKLIRIVGNTLIPYDVKSLSKLTAIDADTIRVAMELFKQIGLIEILDTGEIYLSQINEMIGSETNKAQLMRNKRAQEKLSGNNVTEVLPKCYTEIRDRDIEIRDRDIEIRDRDIEIRDRDIENTAPSDLENHSMPIIELTLNDKSLYAIYPDQLTEWKELFPNVDVMQELKKMKGWLNANPTKRKTRRGITRFINGWLTREQDNPKQKNLTQSRKETERNADYDEFS